ncbi:PAS domain S-box protein [Archangium violaceum]|uniref:ATP-binding protein n=1 Tax=Archangium violaceum TaxID=83451 RepID=UPI00194E74CC|nr:cache domain-containing protein [Archangium violaceum]QRN98532.1 PAS domain S-box protein [Archangium violaceum]
MNPRPTRFRLHFHGKLLAAFVLVLLPVLGLLIAGFLSDLRRTQAFILEAQSLTAQSVAVQVSEVFDGAIGLGWAVAQDPMIRALDPGVLDSHLRTMVEHSPLYESIGVYDAQGIQRGWGGPAGFAEPGPDIHDRPYFQQVMASNSPVISDVQEMEHTRRAGLIAIIPIHGDGGRSIGVVTIRLRSEQLADRFLDARFQQRQVILLVDPSGRLAFHTGAAYLPYRQSGSYLHFDAVHEALKGLPSRLARFKSPFLGDEHLGAFTPVPRYPWAVGVSVERDLALAPIYAQMRLRLGVFGGILVLSLLLALGLTRFYARPVRQLRAAALALGRGDREARVHIQTGDEMEDLGTAFNTMAAEVARRETEVNALHKEAEHQALELAAIINSVPDAIFLASPEGRVVSTNPAGARLVGFKGQATFDEIPLSESLQRYDLRHPDGRPMAQKELPLARALRGETFTDAEMRLRSLDGRQLLLSTNGAPVRDASGQIILGEIVMRDITRHRQEEEALRRSEESLAQAQRIAHLGNWDWDLASNQFHGSDEVCRILGLAPYACALSYETLLSLVPPDERQGIEKAMEAARERLEPFRLDHRILRPDGTERIVHQEVEVLQDEEGHPVRILGTVQDITEHKRVEDELERLLDQELALARVGQALVSEVELERIAEVVIEQSLHSLRADVVALWLAEPERRELTLLASHHLPKDERLGHLSFDAPVLAAQAARTELIQVVEDVQTEGQPGVSCIWAEEGVRGVAAFPLRSRGRLVGVMTYGTYATRTFSSRELEFHSTLGQLFAVAIEKARLFQQVRDALRLREEFMAAAAHELKTPVTAIQTWAEVLLEKEAPTPRQSKGLAAIARNTRRITRLVEHLFAAVKMAPGVPKLKRQPFELHALIQERVEKAAGTTECPIHVEAPDSLVVDGDGYLLGEVLSHLLENAIRYSPQSGGAIELEARRQGGEVVVSVHDHGPGIPPERQPHVFEPLYEPVPPGSPGYTGVVGLGLYLCRQIIEAHGGHIWLTSSPGKGSTFSFRIPLAEASSGEHLPVSGPERELLLPG